MNVLGLLYSASIAFFITLFFATALKVKGPWGNFWTFFVVLLLTALAANFWIEPIGPQYREVYWIPPMAAVLLMALLLAAATKPSPKSKIKLEQKSKEYIEIKATFLAVGIFFWFVVTFMLILVLIGLLNEI